MGSVLPPKVTNPVSWMPYILKNPCAAFGGKHCSSLCVYSLCIRLIAFTKSANYFSSGICCYGVSVYFAGDVISTLLPLLPGSTFWPIHASAGSSRIFWSFPSASWFWNTDTAFHMHNTLNVRIWRKFLLSSHTAPKGSLGMLLMVLGVRHLVNWWPLTLLHQEMI